MHRKSFFNVWFINYFTNALWNDGQWTMNAQNNTNKWKQTKKEPFSLCILFYCQSRYSNRSKMFDWCWFKWTHSDWNARASLNCQSSWAEQYIRRNGKKMLFTLHTTIVKDLFSGAAQHQTQRTHTHTNTSEQLSVETMLATSSTTEAETLSHFFMYARVFVCQSEKKNVFWWTFSVLIWLSSNVGYAIVLNSRHSHVVLRTRCVYLRTYAADTELSTQRKCFIFLFSTVFITLVAAVYGVINHTNYSCEHVCGEMLVDLIATLLMNTFISNDIA